ncbi:MAG: hypothetical protein JWQ43_1711 [Glaciihabitans sp.]|nr:hypothetical protein [Glaciihabitans sp.]
MRRRRPDDGPRSALAGRGPASPRPITTSTVSTTEPARGCAWRSVVSAPVLGWSSADISPPSTRPWRAVNSGRRPRASGNCSMRTTPSSCGPALPASTFRWTRCQIWRNFSGKDLGLRGRRGIPWNPAPVTSRLHGFDKSVRATPSRDISGSLPIRKVAVTHRQLSRNVGALPGWPRGEICPEPPGT